LERLEVVVGVAERVELVESRVAGGPVLVAVDVVVLEARSPAAALS